MFCGCCLRRDHIRRHKWRKVEAICETVLSLPVKVCRGWSTPATKQPAPKQPAQVNTPKQSVVSAPTAAQHKPAAATQPVVAVTVGRSGDSSAPANNNTQPAAGRGGSSGVYEAAVKANAESYLRNNRDVYRVCSQIYGNNETLLAGCAVNHYTTYGRSEGRSW